MEHRMLRHKALIQCSRVAFGFSGIVDDEEAATLRDVTPPPAAVIPTTVEKPKKASRPVKEQVVEETQPEESPHVTLGKLISDNQLTAGAVLDAAEQGGIFLDAAIPLIDQPEDVIREILASWDALTAMVKGGAKRFTQHLLSGSCSVSYWLSCGSRLFYATHHSRKLSPFWSFKSGQTNCLRIGMRFLGSSLKSC